MKKILNDIWFNYWFPLVASVIGFVVFTVYYNEFDIWYWIGISLLSGCVVSCIVYFIIKMLQK